MRFNTLTGFRKILNGIEKGNPITISTQEYTYLMNLIPPFKKKELENSMYDGRSLSIVPTP